MSKELTPEDKAAIKARQSKVGRSNVRRSKSHERRVARLLTDWSGVEFRRRRVEGRDVTTIERESTADVIPVKGDIHFSIEAKCGVVTSFDALMANPTGTNFCEWWHQSNYDVSLISKHFGRQFYPMMFFKPHPNFDWVAISAYAFTRKVLKPRPCAGHCESATLAGCPVWFPHLYFDAYLYVGEVSCNVVRTKNKANFRYVPLNLDPIIFCRWKDFAEHVGPQSFFITPLPPQSYPEAVEVSDGVRQLQPGASDEGGASNSNSPAPAAG